MLLSLKNAEENKLEIKRQLLTETIHRTENSVQKLRETPLFFYWLKNLDGEHLTIAKNLFRAISADNAASMQVRFLDHKGKEQIRKNRRQTGARPLLCQTNICRISLPATIFATPSTSQKNCHVSRFGLNVENKHIEGPSYPTLRSHHLLFIMGRPGEEL